LRERFLSDASVPELENDKEVEGALTPVWEVTMESRVTNKGL
jgi:hypothetical protein